MAVIFIASSIPGDDMPGFAGWDAILRRVPI